MPLPDGALGHYRTNHRFVFTNAQAANSRLFEVANLSASVLVVPTQLTVTFLATGGQTAAIENSLDVFKCTGFSVVDTTNTVTPTYSKKRTTQTNATATIRGLTIAGNVNGMTGGTLTKDSNTIGQLPIWMLAALPTASIVPYQITSDFVDAEDQAPFVFVQNEGLLLESRVIMGAASSGSVYIDFSWSEFGSF